MRKLNQTADEAMDTLDIEEKDRAKYRNWLPDPQQCAVSNTVVHQQVRRAQQPQQRFLKAEAEAADQGTAQHSHENNAGKAALRLLLPAFPHFAGADRAAA